ncbi:MAG: adenylate/guanylate cyclase domain-containing protein [Pseudomonadota bacterium]|nr:adenylate/guanylate cyclase domain-containing protein [Pseudomonadota bacterium]
MSDSDTTAADRAILLQVTEAGLLHLPAQELFGGFCEAVVAAGIPLLRSQMSLAMVHPGLRGYSMTWRRGIGVDAFEGFEHASQAAPAWYRSPGAYMLNNLVTHLHARLEGPERPDPWFELYDDLLAIGVTDYHGVAHPFGWASTADRTNNLGELGMFASWSTDRRGGFGADWDRLEALVRVLALAFKGRTLGDMAENLMSTYLGRDAGLRVLHGEVHRGDIRTIDASILLCDLRGFTAMADRTPKDVLLPLLDTYMEAICAPVDAHGGQVLKFLGDGVLAIFADDDRDTGDKAARALAAATDIRARVAAINADRSALSRPVMPLDIALHEGDVVYGNVGATGRMDFTVIGPAVNEAARMEARCGELGVDILLSDAFVAGLPDRTAVVALGNHSLRGVSRPRALFTLAGS